MKNLLRRLNEMSHESVSRALFESALCSMEHGLEHYREEQGENRLRFALLHVSHSVELLLKSLLAKENKYFVLKDMDNHRRGTVNVTEACLRLKKLMGIALTDRDEKFIERIRQTRNAIEHFLAEEVANDVESVIDYTICFWWALVKKYTSYDDSLLLSSDKLRIVLDIDDKHHRIIVAAQEKLRTEIDRFSSEARRNHDIQFCPSCYEQMLLVDFVNRSARCFYCNDSMSVGACSDCARILPLEESPDGSQLCQRCYDIPIEVYQKYLEDTTKEGSEFRDFDE